MADLSASDEDLMLRLQRHREEDAFNQLFARYRAAITSYLYRLVGNRNEAESLAQDAFMRVLQKAEHYQYPRRFSTWFYTISRNLATDFLKKKRAVVPDDFHGLSESIMGTSEPEAEAQVTEREELDELISVLQALPVVYREVVILRALQELSYREIAAIVNCPESTARSRMDYGLDYIRKHYRKREGKNFFPGNDKMPN
jgi:RNA polymerase sigma-70 factor (ECF subfamily)